MKSTALLTRVALCACLFTTSHAAADELLLADGGQSRYQIVLPDQSASPSVEQSLAAVGYLLQQTFAINGTDIPVVAESARDPEKPGIFIGATRFAGENGVPIDELEGWSYIHLVIDENVVIAGKDQPTAIEGSGANRYNRQDWDRIATAKAAADFLREYAGVRFLYNDTGTNLDSIETMDLANTPALEFLPTPTTQR